MNKEFSAKEIIRQHIESDKIIESVSMTADYKTNNREAKKLVKLFNVVKDNISLANEVYAVLLNEDSVTTRSISAAECLRIGIYIHESEKILEELSQRNDIGITRLSCEMALKLWRGEIPGKTL